MDTVWVLGGGQFGRHACQQLRQKDAEATIIVVDKQASHDLPADVHHVCEDAVTWLTKQFTADAAVSMVIPALPLHLAAEWLKKKLSADSRTVQPVTLPDTLLGQLPNPIRLNPDNAVISHADFLCPSNCLEPDELCSFTCKKRPQPLFEILEEMSYRDFSPVIIRSRQFAPGVGGFLPDDLWTLLQSARSRSDMPLLIGTACKCHGAITGISHEKL